jgi:RTX calcium-binding nonapeptide repeat (4 copies)
VIVRLWTSITLVVVLVVIGTATADAVTVFGTGGNDSLTGGPDDDSLYGRAGADALNGAGGNDDLDGGPDADDLRGGPGTDDAVVYAGTTGVMVTLDDDDDDGAPGERDNVHRDVEDIYGGEGDDTLTGSTVRNTIDGDGGADRLRGGEGPDFLFGGGGNDGLDARDGERDLVDCGPGEDVAAAEQVDRTIGCDVVTGTLPEPGFVLAVVDEQLTPQRGTSQREACRTRGHARLVLLRNGRRLGRARVRLDRLCRFRKDFVLPERRVGAATRLPVRIRFSGTDDLGKITYTSRARVVRVG